MQRQDTTATEHTKAHYNTEEATILLNLIQEKIRTLKEIERKLITQIQEQTQNTQHTQATEFHYVETKQKGNTESEQEKKIYPTPEIEQDINIESEQEENESTYIRPKYGIAIISPTKINDTLKSEILRNVNSTLHRTPTIPLTKQNVMIIPTDDQNSQEDINKTILSSHPNKKFIITKLHDESYHRKFKASIKTTYFEDIKDTINSIIKATEENKIEDLHTIYSRKRNQHQITIAHDKKPVLNYVVQESKGLLSN